MEFSLDTEEGKLTIIAESKRDAFRLGELNRSLHEQGTFDGWISQADESEVRLRVRLEGS